MPIEWSDILKISASSSVLTSLIAWCLNHFFVQRKALKRDARYLAQRVAVILEKLAIDCADIIASNDLHRGSGGHAGKLILSMPEVGPLPTDTDWKAIDPDLVDRVLSMPTRLTLAQGAIAFWWDVVGDEDCMETEADQQAGQCGFEAWVLASELRQRYGIPISDLATNTWDFVGTLKKENNAAQERRRKAANGS